MNRRKFSVIALVALFITFLGAPLTRADEKTPEGELRVGMEAGYAPFNWTQKDDRNGAVPIQGDKAYAGGYDVQMAKRSLTK